MEPKKDVKDRISDAFVAVLKQKPFSKAKVTEIIRAAGISHQTFYRYYVDKYDLALKLTMEKFFAFRMIYGDNATWKEIVYSMLHSIKNNPSFFKRLLADSEGSTIVVKSICGISKETTGLSAYEPGVSGWAYILGDWSRTNFTTPIDAVYYQIRRTVPVQDALTEEEMEQIMSVYEARRMDYFIDKAKARLPKKD